MHPALDSPEGAELVAAAERMAIDAAKDPLRGVEALRRSFPEADPELVRAALTQASLARRAVSRFGAAGAAMLWTPDGLEQASRPAAARHRAARLVALGAARAADLTCGVGVDALALAAAGIAVLAVEADAATADLARANARTLGDGRVEVLTGSCTDEQTVATVRDFAADAWFIDPGRRGQARAADGRHLRLDDPQAWSPPWSWVRAQAGAAPIVMAKAAPGTPHEDLCEAVPGCRASVEWVSARGDLLEACATWLREDDPRATWLRGGVPGATWLRGGVPGATWLRGEEPGATWQGPDGATWGELGGAAGRSAVLIDEHGEVLLRVPWTGAEAPEGGLPAPGEYLLDPDPAVVRSGTVAELAELIGARLVDPHLAYLVAAAPPSGSARAAVRAWQVVASAGRYDPRALRRACSDAGIVAVDLLGRGRRLAPEQVARDLRLPGGPGPRGALIAMSLGERRSTAIVLGLPAA